MMCRLFLSWTLLLSVSGSLLAHPITDSTEMAYSGPVSAEEGPALSVDEPSLSDQAYLSQSGTALGYPTLLARELSRDGLRTAGFFPREALKEVLLEKQSRLNPLIRFLGTRKQYRKRGNTSECFWKYCV
ncbi:prepro-urotensin II-beta [Scleropages formosus]|uniref:prepro-urotensin II-beta n=1 Tax=Scleropages formosus TaxID=113540 RepID=UPI00087809A5|nr:prepro-urotensin II-beta-like [Scleropages formosus]